MKFSRYVIPAYVTLLLSIAVTASAEDAKVNYEHTNAQGTHVKVESHSNNTADSKGNVDESSSYKSETDPKGLMNKTKVSSQSKHEKDEDGDETTSKEIVESSGTVRKETKDVDVDRHLDGSETTTVEKTGVVDPKGLLNKETHTTTEKVEKNADGAITGTSVTKK